MVDRSRDPGAETARTPGSCIGPDPAALPRRRRSRSYGQEYDFRRQLQETKQNGTKKRNVTKRRRGDPGGRRARSGDPPRPAGARVMSSSSPTVPLSRCGGWPFTGCFEWLGTPIRGWPGEIAPYRSRPQNAGEVVTLACPWGCRKGGGSSRSASCTPRPGQTGVLPERCTGVWFRVTQCCCETSHLVVGVSGRSRGSGIGRPVVRSGAYCASRRSCP